MIRRVLCVGTEGAAAAFRRAAGFGGASGETPGEVLVVEGDGRGVRDRVLARLAAGEGDYDAVCVLEPLPGLADIVAACGEAGLSVLVAGPPTEDLGELERLAAAFAWPRAALAAGGLVAAAPAACAVLEAAAGRRVGAPVYLRYAAEAGTPDALLWHAADAIDFAAEALGEPVDVCAAGVQDASGALVHVALTVRHRAGAVAVLGLGCADSGGGVGGGPGGDGRGDHASVATRGYSSLLLIGDRGVVEGQPAAGGVIVRDGDPAPAATGLRDDYAAGLAGWLTASESLLDGEAPHAAALRRARRLVGAAAAVRRSLRTGQPERVMSDE
jgi:hypothetical protein